MAIEILSYEETPLGTICLRRRELLSKPGTLVTEVTLNHEFLMSSYLTESERALTQFGMELLQTDRVQTKEGLAVMVGGLGLGYTAFEALKSPGVATVDVIEFLPTVASWLHDNLIPLAEQLNADERLNVSLGDVYLRLSQPPSTIYDLIAIDVDHSPEDVLGDQSHGFYTEPGLQSARQHLRPGGVLGVWSYADDTPLLEKMKQVFDSVSVRQVTVWNDLIDVEQTDWLFFGQREE